MCPQIGYSTVFFWEYFGPLVVYALIFAFPEFVYSKQKYVVLDAGADQPTDAPSVGSTCCFGDGLA